MTASLPFGQQHLSRIYACKLAKLLALFSLAVLAPIGAAVGGRKRLVAACLALSLTLSIEASAGVNGMAMAAELLFPSLVAQHYHDHNHSHDAYHDDEHGHDVEQDHGNGHDAEDEDQ